MTETENFTKEEIIDALLENDTIQPTANSLTENGLELREMGFRDISEADEKEFLRMAMKDIQVQRTLNDLSRGSIDKRSTYDYLNQHADFLVNISPGKTKKDIVANMTVEHAAAIMKISAKTDIPEKLLKKHLNRLKTNYA